MPHVRQLPSGRWQIAFREGPREARRTKFRVLGPEVVTRADAKLAARVMAGELAASPVVPGTGLKTLGDALDEWLAIKREKREVSTVLGYKHHVDVFKRGLRADQKLRDVTPEAIEAFLAKREAETSGRAAAKVLVTLRGFFRWAIKKKHMRAPSPVDAVDWEPEEREDRDELEACPREVLVDHLRALHRERLEPVCVRSSRRAEGYERDRTEAETHAFRLYASVLRVLWGTGLRAVDVCRWSPEDVRVDAPIPAIRVRAPKNKGRAPE